MTADVGQRAQPARRKVRLGFAANDHERNVADLRNDVIAGVGNLRCVSDQLPASRKHGGTLELLELRVDVTRGRQRERTICRLRFEPIRIQHGH